MISEKTAELLNEKYLKYNQIEFIESDPIFVPHQFTKKQDIEIAGLFAAVFAWGQRKTIISKSLELMQLFDLSPYDFILHATNQDLKSLQNFKHRTFNYTDLLCFIEFLKNHYQQHESLECAFYKSAENTMKENLIFFNQYFFNNKDFPSRTRKHLSTPAKNSACKRINMYLRWMVRQDNYGVDFGIWRNIKTENLIIPCDVHVEKSARILGITTRPKADWKMADEITQNLKSLDSKDPVKYDFALFGLGIEKYFGI